MGEKLYKTNEQGGIEFQSTRRPGEVRIPNYVYDLWMPLLGIEVIGVYAVYCRLEREGGVKGITQADLARCCKIGVRRLNDINAVLAEHGFIFLEKPRGQDRLKHYTTKITVNDPPGKIDADTITKHDEGRKTTKYQPLTTWLIASSEMSNDFSGEAKQHLVETSNDNAKIAPSILQPSIDCSSLKAAAGEKSEPFHASEKVASEIYATPPTPSPVSVEPPPRLHVYTLYEKAFGLLVSSEMLKDQLADMERDYPVDWLNDAFEEAVAHGGKTIAYVRAILDRWQREGKPRKAAPVVDKPAAKTEPEAPKVAFTLPTPEQMMESLKNAGINLDRQTA